MDLDHEARNYPQDQLISMYFGGGTPSIMSTSSIATLIEKARNLFSFSSTMEITLEVNPGTLDLLAYQQLREIGVNRISLGAQSFNNQVLKNIHRIHGCHQIFQAIDEIKTAGFNNFNLDLIFALPEQTMAMSADDLKEALKLAPSHVSWYQLSLEFHSSNHRMYHSLPNQEELWNMQQSGIELLQNNGFGQYEVSAYAKSPAYFCQHNLNYWNYGDYLGIGSGAHGKVTMDDYKIQRYSKIADPKEYLAATNIYETMEIVNKKKVPFEFMLNALRLYRPITHELFKQRTGINIESIYNELNQAEEQQLIKLTAETIAITERGKNFLNDLLCIFL